MSCRARSSGEAFGCADSSWAHAMEGSRPSTATTIREVAIFFLSGIGASRYREGESDKGSIAEECQSRPLELGWTACLGLLNDTMLRAAPVEMSGSACVSVDSWHGALL